MHVSTAYNLDLEWEFLWDDPECEERAYAEATRLHTKIIGHFDPIVAAHQANPEKGYFLSFDSSVPCGDWLSTKVTGSNAVTVMRMKAIDVPAIPGRISAKERFDTSHYSPAQKKYGLSKLQMILSTLLYHPYGILYLNSQQIVVPMEIGGQSRNGVPVGS